MQNSEEYREPGMVEDCNNCNEQVCDESNMPVCGALLCVNAFGASLEAARYTITGSLSGLTPAVLGAGVGFTTLWFLRQACRPEKSSQLHEPLAPSQRTPIISTPIRATDEGSTPFGTPAEEEMRRSIDLRALPN